MKAYIIFIVAVLLAITSCKTKKETSSVTETSPLPGQPAQQTQTTPATQNPVNETAANTNTMAATENLTQGMTWFGFDFFKYITTEKSNENICFSPVSLNVALAMVYSGARENTYNEMSQVLHFTKDYNTFHEEFDAFYRNLNAMGNDTALQFNLANRIFIENTYRVLDSYRNIINTHYSGAFENVDFMHSPAQVTEHINKWVEKMTMDKIKNLIPVGLLDESTKMVLVNAIYIKSKWKYAFDPKLNQVKDFNISDSEKKSTEFMIKKQDGIRYYKDDKVSAIELPYTSQQLSLVIIKPNRMTKEGINAFVPDAAGYQAILDGMQRREVHMEIPKFKIETTFSLSDPLREKGMKDAFSGSANFSGISEFNDLTIDKVLQKVFFEVDEKGTEAAAATAIVMRTTSSANHYDLDRTVYFIANEPFIFILKENNSNTPLFIGQFVKP
ncbi:MAG: serpin family protein [Bacteroidales bacterium]|nr:serpin family protein [Bacteroidales bacterium]